MSTYLTYPFSTAPATIEKLIDQGRIDFHIDHVAANEHEARSWLHKHGGNSAVTFRATKANEHPIVVRMHKALEELQADVEAGRESVSKLDESRAICERIVNEEHARLIAQGEYEAMWLVRV